MKLISILFSTIIFFSSFAFGNSGSVGQMFQNARQGLTNTYNSLTGNASYDPSMLRDRAEVIKARIQAERERNLQMAAEPNFAQTPQGEHAAAMEELRGTNCAKAELESRMTENFDNHCLRPAETAGRSCGTSAEVTMTAGTSSGALPTNGSPESLLDTYRGIVGQFNIMIEANKTCAEMATAAMNPTCQSLLDLGNYEPQIERIAKTCDESDVDEFVDSMVQRLTTYGQIINESVIVPHKASRAQEPQVAAAIIEFEKVLVQVYSDREATVQAARGPASAE